MVWLLSTRVAKVNVSEVRFPFTTDNKMIVKVVAGDGDWQRGLQFNAGFEPRCEVKDNIPVFLPAISIPK
jgi:hypothetical protein